MCGKRRMVFDVCVVFCLSLFVSRSLRSCMRLDACVRACACVCACACEWECAREGVGVGVGVGLSGSMNIKECETLSARVCLRDLGHTNTFLLVLFIIRSSDILILNTFISLFSPSPSTHITDT